MIDKMEPLTNIIIFILTLSDFWKFYHSHKLSTSIWICHSPSSHHTKLLIFNNFCRYRSSLITAENEPQGACRLSFIVVVDNVMMTQRLSSRQHFSAYYTFSSMSSHLIPRWRTWECKKGKFIMMKATSSCNNSLTINLCVTTEMLVSRSLFHSSSVDIHICTVVT